MFLVSLSIVLLIYLCINPVFTGTLQKVNEIFVVDLSPDTYYNMGIQYGELLADQLKEVLQIYHDYYVVQHKVEYDQIVKLSNSLFYKYTLNIQEMIQGVSKGSKIGMDDCVVLSAMQFISPYFVPDHSKFQEEKGQCSFFSIENRRTKSKFPIIGRFFDLFKPYELVVKYLTITKFPAHDPQNPDAFGEKSFFSIGFPGEIQCLTCLNELGGKTVYWDREFMPARFFEIVENSIDAYQMYYQMNAIRPDFSWIINFLGPKTPELLFSVEYSSEKDTLKASITKQEDYVVTNFFVNSTWRGIPKPTDQKTWHGVTRRNNLVKLLKSLREEDITIEMVQSEVMDVKMEDGGAMWNETVYQVIYDPERIELYVRAPHVDMTWSVFNFGD